MKTINPYMIKSEFFYVVLYITLRLISKQYTFFSLLQNLINKKPMIFCIALKLSSSRWTSGLVERKQASSSRLGLFIKLLARCSSFHRVGDQVFRQETNDLNLTHSSPYLWNIQVKKRSQVMLDSINWYLSWLRSLLVLGCMWVGWKEICLFNQIIRNMF